MTTMLRLISGETRKLSTTKLPYGFLAMLAIAELETTIVAFATEMDGSKVPVCSVRSRWPASTGTARSSPRS